MTRHLDDDVLDELCLGLLPADEAAAAERHLAECAHCTEALARASDVYGVLALSALPVTPAPALRERLFASLGGRFERFAAEVARILDVAADRARQLLAGIDDPRSWTPGPGEGVELYHLEGGLALRSAVAGIVRIRPGGSFPEHRHFGEETTLVMQGGYEDDHGVVLHAGEVRVSEAGSSHSFVALPGEELVYLSVIQDGLAIGDLVFLPGDPRV